MILLQTNNFHHMRNWLKYILRFLLWTVLTVMSVVTLTLILIQTGPVKKQIASFAEKQSQRFINGDLNIGKIEGNFISRLVLENILVTLDNDTIIYIQELDAGYDLRPLLNNKILIHYAVITRPYLCLSQNKDSVWSLQQIIKQREDQEKDTIQQSKTDLDLPVFRIIEGRIKTDVRDTVIPRQIRNVNAKAEFHWSGKRQSATIENFSFVTLNPAITLEQLRFNVKRDSNYIELNDLYIKTAKNQIEGNAEFDSNPHVTGSANVRTSEVQLNEFEYFIPGFRIPASPEIIINSRLQKDSVYLELEMTDQDQKILMDIRSLNPFIFFAGDSVNNLPYNVNSKFDNIRLSHWLGDPDMQYLINGRLSVKGRGTGIDKGNLFIKGDLSDSEIKNERLDELILDINMEDGKAGGFIRGKGNFGEFILYPEIQNIIDHPVYQADLSTKNLDLSVITGNDSLFSDLNITASVSGEWFDPEQLDSDAEIVLSDSRFRQINIDTLHTIAHYENENIIIDSLWLLTEKTQLAASGNYALRSDPGNPGANSYINLLYEFDGLEEFKPYIPLEGLETAGRMNASLKGEAGSLEITSEIELSGNRYRQISLGHLSLISQIRLTPDDTSFNARIHAENLNTGDLTVDSLTADTKGDLDSLTVKAIISSNEINTQLETGIKPGKKMKFVLADWTVTFKDQKWELQNAPAFVEIDSVNYIIDNLRMASHFGDTLQYIEAEGNISRRGREDFRLTIANVDITRLGEMFSFDNPVSGILNINLNLKGTYSAPLIKANFVVDSAAVNDYHYTDFGGTLDYNNNLLKVGTKIVPKDSGKVEITAALPMQVNPDSVIFNFDHNDSIKVDLIVERLPLAVLGSLDVTEEINGYLEGGINLGGTYKSPFPEGNLTLKEGSFIMKEYGIDYDHIEMNIDFLSGRVKLDTLLITSSDGSLTGAGELNFKSGLPNWKVTESGIHLNFNRFNLFDHSQFNIQLSGDVNLSGDRGDLVYGGNLIIPQSEIYLPAILTMMNRMYVPDIPKPILVREVESMSNYVDTSHIKKLEPMASDTIDIDYPENLTGKLQLRIPRNSWIKNEDMRIEVSGELDLIKNEEFFELFGSIDIVRGQYDLLGKTFIIDEGTVSFEGGSEITPGMDIRATYTFRNPQRIRQAITVDITGTPESPSINFQLDGDPVTEGDALSYILFGKSLDELTMEEQENLGDTDLSGFAEKAAASVISSQITSFLGDKLNVDYIEVRTDENFDKASVVVGKYITNDLFVSYEQRFGEIEDKSLATYEVELEYELFRFLFFVLNNSSTHSGFDVIVKLNSK